MTAETSERSPCPEVNVPTEQPVDAPPLSEAPTNHDTENPKIPVTEENAVVEDAEKENGRVQQAGSVGANSADDDVQMRDVETGEGSADVKGDIQEDVKMADGGEQETVVENNIKMEEGAGNVVDDDADLAMTTTQPPPPLSAATTTNNSPPTTTTTAFTQNQSEIDSKTHIEDNSTTYTVSQQIPISLDIKLTEEIKLEPVNTITGIADIPMTSIIDNEGGLKFGPGEEEAISTEAVVAAVLAEGPNGELPPELSLQIQSLAASDPNHMLNGGEILDGNGNPLSAVAQSLRPISPPNVPADDGEQRIIAYAKLLFDYGYDYYMKELNLILGREGDTAQQQQQKRLQEEQQAQFGSNATLAPQPGTTTSLSPGLAALDSPLLGKKKRSKKSGASSSHVSGSRKGKSSSSSHKTGNGNVPTTPIVSRHQSLNDDPYAGEEFLTIRHPDGRPLRNVSRRHARITFNFDKQKFELQVLGKNGVFVNGTHFRTDETAELESGSKIQIGRVELSFLLPDTVPEDSDGTGQPSNQPPYAITNGGHRMSLSFHDERGIEVPPDSFEEDAMESYSGMSVAGSDEEGEIDDEEEDVDDDDDGGEENDEDEGDEDEEVIEDEEAMMYDSEGNVVEQLEDGDDEGDGEGEDDEEGGEDEDDDDEDEDDDEKEEYDDDGKVASKSRKSSASNRSRGKPTKPTPSVRDQKREQKAAKKKAEEAAKRKLKASAKEAAKAKAREKEREKRAKEREKREKARAKAKAEKLKLERKQEREAEKMRLVKEKEERKRLQQEAKEARIKEAREAKEAAKEAKPPKPPKEKKKKKRSPSPPINEAELPPEALLKPTVPYSVMIFDAIMSSETKKLSLPDLYRSIERSYPYFKLRAATHGWQSSVRHNLRGCPELFYTVEKEGKGYLWGVKDGANVDKERKKRRGISSPPPPNFHHPPHGLPPHPPPHPPPPMHPQNAPVPMHASSPPQPGPTQPMTVIQPNQQHPKGVWVTNPHAQQLPPQARLPQAASAQTPQKTMPQTMVHNVNQGALQKPISQPQTPVARPVTNTVVPNNSTTIAQTKVIHPPKPPPHPAAVIAAAATAAAPQTRPAAILPTASQASTAVPQKRPAPTDTTQTRPAATPRPINAAAAKPATPKMDPKTLAALTQFHSALTAQLNNKTPGAGGATAPSGVNQAQIQNVLQVFAGGGGVGGTAGVQNNAITKAIVDAVSKFGKPGATIPATTTRVANTVSAAPSNVSTTPRVPAANISASTAPSSANAVSTPTATKNAPNPVSAVQRPAAAAAAPLASNLTPNRPAPASTQSQAAAKIIAGPSGPNKAQLLQLLAALQKKSAAAAGTTTSSQASPVAKPGGPSSSAAAIPMTKPSISQSPPAPSTSNVNVNGKRPAEELSTTPAKRPAQETPKKDQP